MILSSLEAEAEVRTGDCVPSAFILFTPIIHPSQKRFRDGQPTEREQEVASAAARSRTTRDISHRRATNSFRKLGHCK